MNTANSIWWKYLFIFNTSGMRSSYKYAKDIVVEYDYQSAGYVVFIERHFGV